MMDIRMPPSLGRTKWKANPQGNGVIQRRASCWLQTRKSLAGLVPSDHCNCSYKGLYIYNGHLHSHHCTYPCILLFLGLVRHRIHITNRLSTVSLQRRKYVVLSCGVCVGWAPINFKFKMWMNVEGIHLCSRVRGQLQVFNMDIAPPPTSPR